MTSRRSPKSSQRIGSAHVTRGPALKKKSLTKTALSKKTALKDHVSVVDAIVGQIESSSLRRDFNLVRLILMEAEQPDTHAFSFDGYNQAMVQAHLILLIEAGFLHGSILREGNGETHALVNRLTWTGHDLLALMRNTVRWREASTAVLDSHGRGHLDVLVAWLKSQ